jgi:hypothetical protein
LSIAPQKPVAEFRQATKMSVPLLIQTGRTPSCVTGRNL